MAKYSKSAGKKVEEVMHEFKEGKLKTGTGKKVSSRKQAIAIGLSEAREEGAKVPDKNSSSKKSSSSSTKTSSKSAAAKKSSSGSKGSKRGLASASAATKKRVAAKGGKASSKKS